MKIPGDDLLCSFCGSDDLAEYTYVPPAGSPITGRAYRGVSCLKCGAVWAFLPGELLLGCVQGPRQVTIVGELAQPEIEAGP